MSLYPGAAGDLSGLPTLPANVPPFLTIPSAPAQTKQGSIWTDWILPIAQIGTAITVAALNRPKQPATGATQSAGLVAAPAKTGAMQTPFGTFSPVVVYSAIGVAILLAFFVVRK
ncbi:MAG: hypothetical protein ACREUY_05090 [Burkholderiales bacterium]